MPRVLYPDIGRRGHRSWVFYRLPDGWDLADAFVMAELSLQGTEIPQKDRTSPVHHWKGMWNNCKTWKVDWHEMKTFKYLL